MDTRAAMAWAKTQKSPFDILDELGFGRSPQSVAKTPDLVETPEQLARRRENEQGYARMVDRENARRRDQERERLASSPHQWLPGASSAAVPSATPVPLALERHGDPKPGFLDRLGLGAKRAPEAWSTDPEAAALRGLHDPGALHEASHQSVRDRHAAREAVRHVPHLAFGMSAADRSSPYVAELATKKVPGLAGCRIDGIHGRGEADRTTRWDVVAQASAVAARDWIAQPGQHGLGERMNQAVRSAAVDRLAWSGPDFVGDAGLVQQMEASASVVSHRAAVYLSNGPQVEASLPAIAAEVERQGDFSRRFAHLEGYVPAPGPGIGVEEGREWIATALRAERAMAQAGLLRPLDVARLAMREENAAFDAVDRAALKRAVPDFTLADEHSRTRRMEAMNAALGRQKEAATPAPTMEAAVARAPQAALAAVASREGRGI